MTMPRFRMSQVHVIFIHLADTYTSHWSDMNHKGGNCISLYMICINEIQNIRKYPQPVLKILMTLNLHNFIYQ